MKLGPFAAALLLGASAPAQTTFDIAWASTVPPARQIAVTVTETVASARPGGYGWVTVDLKNRDLDEHRVEILLEEAFSRDASFEARRRLNLVGGEGVRIWLPLPGLLRDMSVRVLADGNRREGGYHRFDASVRGGSGFSVLVVGDEARAESDWRAALESLSADFESGTVSRWVNGKQVSERIAALSRYAWRTPADLPAEWWMMSGFDLVVVDANAAIDAVVQGTLASYLRAGGDLLVLNAESLDRGSVLGSAIGGWNAPVGEGRYGFGSWAAVDALRSRGLASAVRDRGADARLLRWLDDEALAAHGRQRSGPVHADFGADLAIPGLGRVPVGLFFFIVLGFAVLAGPFSYFYWKRRRRLAMLLVTVPASGAVVTVAMLGFGLLSEGLGVKGAVATVTLLDQRDHTAVTVSARTMYAGLTPGRVTPAPATYVFSNDVAEGRAWNDPETHVLEFDLDRDELGGRLVSARTVANVRTVSIATRRERLRFRHRADGRVEVLQSPALQLADGPSDRVAVRTFGGTWYVGASNGILEAVEETAAPHWLLERIEQTPGCRGVAEALPPGSYVALVAEDPGLDPLGLEVEWLTRHHVIVGRLAEEDVVHD